MAKTGLVVSAHPGDFVWRAGGAVALHAKKGYRVKIVCLAFGERGESQFAWKQPGITLRRSRPAAATRRSGRRQRSAPRSNSSMPATTRCILRGTYGPADRHLPRTQSEFRADARARGPTMSTIRRRRPTPRKRASSPRRWARSRRPTTPDSAPPAFLFELHQPDMCNFKPQVILKIDEVWDIKRRTIEFSRRRSICGPIMEGPRWSGARRAVALG